MESAVELDPPARRRLLVALSLINVGLGAATALFIYTWERLDTYPRPAQQFIKHILVQGHLATENVLAAWYSSMLLLAVALAALAALVADLRDPRTRLGWGWLLVAGAFVILSMDEIGSWHERIGMLRSLSGSGDRAVGWVFVLGVPIAIVGLFLLAFAFFHVRRVPVAFRWMAAGVLLFLSNPVFEAVEMRLIHGAGVDPTTWQRTLHDVLLVLEEGVLELFGIVCFLMGVLAYLEGTARPLTLRFDPGRARTAVRLLTLLMAIGVFAAAAIAARLPPGDTGLPANWFPAAMFVLAALASARWRWGWLALSALCGAGLYGYVRILAYGAPIMAAFAVAIAGWALEAAIESRRTTVPRTSGP